MADVIITPTQEQLGRRRFPDGSEFFRTLSESSERVRTRLLQSLASNYPKSPETNLGVLYTAVSEEFSRLSFSLSSIHEDKFHDTTRQEHLFQILGDHLFLAEKAINPELNGEEYRDFLLKVRNSYFKGSRKKNIEETVSDILGVTVVLKELFEEAKKENSIYGIKDTHKMFFDIFMDEGSPTDNVGKLIQDLIFFINLIRPSHVLYNTRFIWKDDYNINRRKELSFGRDTNGCTPEYDYAVSAEVILYLVKASLFVGTGSDVVEDSWEDGTISDINIDERVITLTNGRKLIFGSKTLFYDRDSEGDFRIEITDFNINDDIKYFGLLAPGPFQFYNVPEEIQTGIYKQFDVKVIEKPYFQENVKKTYDSKGRFENVTKEFNTTICSPKVTDILIPNYEDLRDNCDLPDVKPVSDFFFTVNLDPELDGPGVKNLPGHFIAVEGDAVNVFTLTRTPVLDKDGNLAEPNDLILFINEFKIEDGVQSIDSLTGEVVLNFMVPSNSAVRIDYWFSRRYPNLTEFTYTWPSDSVPGSGGDIPASMTAIEIGQIVKRLKWPYTVTVPSLFGDDRDYQVDKFPILNRLGNLADVNDITVFVNDLEVSGAVRFVRPLLGHIGLNFLPPQGAAVRFRYYYSDQNRTYVYVPDDLGYTSDTVFGNRSLFTLIIDSNPPGGVLEHVFVDLKILKVGYRWRAFDLSASSIFNSEDTLIVNGTNREFNKSTVKNSPNRLNLAKVVFSPEHLKDTAKKVILNDTYLTNGLTPELFLRVGTPPFIKTFTDDGRFTFANRVVPTESSFGDGGESSFDIEGSLTVLAPKDDSGLVEYNGLSHFRDRKKLSLYSGLRLVTENDNGTDVFLSSICENRNFTFQFGLNEIYFPDRELRSNNYLDYNRFESELLLSGNAKFLNGSKIIKSIGQSWSSVQSGVKLIIPSLEQIFVIAEVLNQETIELNENWTSPSGIYAYEIMVEPTVIPEVLVARVTRRVCIDTSPFYDYSFVEITSEENPIPNLPGQFNLAGSLTVESVFTFCTNFPDPDPDPTPINPGTAPVYPIDDPTSSDYRKRNASKLYRQDSILNFDQVNYVLAGPLVTQTNPVGSLSNAGTPGISSVGPTNRGWNEFVENGSGDLVAVPMSFGVDDSESLYRVRWRNWDQDIVATSFGVITENNITIMNDLGEGIKRFYWRVSTQTLEEHNFFGSVIETSEEVSPSVAAMDHLDGLILITNPDDLIDPNSSGLNDVNYELRNTVIRELLHDNSFQITNIEEFVRL